jgi:hypothetical protein
VDARNRLVASELERRWNAKLEAVEEVKTDLKRLDHETRPLDVHDRQKFMELGRDFARVWNDERCPVTLKKKIIHTVVEEIVVQADDAERILRCIVHWSGGVHTQFEVNWPTSKTVQRTPEDALEIISRLAVRYGDDVIAMVLNRHDLRTGKGNRWTAIRVHTARRNHGIAGQAATLHDAEILSMGEAARHCAVSTTTIRNRVKSGILNMRQLDRFAPWEIQRADLESEAVKSALRRLHAGSC